ncbi:hypothetical protein [Actinomadura latina]|uniref:Uncharacterized protein n=1 Tax=Actinomadura latina TaxID=163603 RepID=A0A846ZA53_9ACTN|nr:hypothetical protein [Actinomadura latina]NKZ08072.1 hypothetical protein [Actinomadura latina]
MTTARPVPRWAEWVAHAVPFTVLPSGLWRIALGLGVPMGFAEGSALADFPHPIGTPYVFALSTVAELFALLAFGLVRPWGEVFPHWFPLVGGRRVPVPFAVGAASLGAVAVTLIGLTGASGWTDAMADSDSPRGFAGTVMTLAYAPFLAWGPLLAILTVHYCRRRTVRGVPAAA